MANRPATTPEGRENQMIQLAITLAEKQLMEGTASSQVITHFLKLGSTKEALEKEKLIKENALLRAKTEQIESQQDLKGLFKDAIRAMSDYSPSESDEE